ncbi:hypothetical protein, partial [Burkholderia gladioli]|uniref:hypothetical protein n=1 Tax=Burkholderia gladioli TaxID=28095 RepID=UPI001ABA21F0
LFQNPDDLAFRESGRLHAKFPVDPAARKFYLEHPLILGGTTAQLGCRPSRLPHVDSFSFILGVLQCKNVPKV